MHITDIPDLGLDWLDASGERADVVLSTRVRLARNLQGHAFGPRARINDREAVLRQMRDRGLRAEALSRARLIELPDVDVRTREILLERRLISRDLLMEEGEVVRGSAVVVSPDGPLGVMVNEEDHLRIQAIVSGSGSTRRGARWIVWTRSSAGNSRTPSTPPTAS